MLLEALSSAILGLVLAWAAYSRLPHRMPARSLVLPTDQVVSGRQHLDVQQVAEEARCSPFHLAHLFRRHLGTSPHQYRLHLRIADALQRLEDTGTRLADLAFELGGRKFAAEATVVPAPNVNDTPPFPVSRHPEIFQVVAPLAL